MRRWGDNWQPALYAVVVGLGAAVGYLIAFVIKNSDETEVDFVFFTETASLVWVILLSLGIGVLTGVALSQLYRRRGRHEAGERGDAAGDLVDADEAVGEPR